MYCTSTCAEQLPGQKNRGAKGPKGQKAKRPKGRMSLSGGSVYPPEGVPGALPRLGAEAADSNLIELPARLVSSHH